MENLSSFLDRAESIIEFCFTKAVVVPDAPTIHLMTMAAKKEASLQTEEQIIQGDEHVSKIIPSFKRRFEASSSTVRRELFNDSEDNPYETPKK